MKTRTIDHIDVFPTRLPVVKTFEFASGLADWLPGTMAARETRDAR